MGLDMYAFTIPAEWAGDTVTDYTPDADRKSEELYYWRKFNALHGWMEQLYRSKGGAKASFNCTTVRLTSEDLDTLERGANELQPVEGFFFGAQTIYPEDRESIADFIAKARQALADGKAVFYDSWW